MCKGGCACKDRLNKTIEGMDMLITDLENIVIRMARYIKGLDIDEDICKKVSCPLGEYETNSEICVACIIDFFGGKNGKADD